MASLISRGAVLTISRVSNYAVLLVSPLLLVRILDVSSFGQYREFMLYAMVLITVSGFTIDSSLPYFLPKNPGQDSKYVTLASLLVFCASLLVVCSILVLRDLITRFTSYDFVLLLCAYVFCFVNLNAIEYYWIAKGRADRVLYYSVGRTLARVTVLLAVAYVTRDLTAILASIVLVEAGRLLVAAVIMQRIGLFTAIFRRDAVKEMLAFITPVGLSQIVDQLSRDVGKFVIAGRLGPSSLAQYAVGSYLLPLIPLLRGSIADVLFPEMVKRDREGDGASHLWSRATVMYCAVMFPAFAVLVIHAELLVRALFTEAYLIAVPIFQIYALVLIRRCFNFDMLLRMTGRTTPILTGRLIQLGVNVPLVIVLFAWLGFVGPAIAFVVSDLLMEVYYSRTVARLQGRKVSEFVDVRGIGFVALGCLICLPILWLPRALPGPEFVWLVVCAPLYMVAAGLVAWRLGVEDVGRIFDFVMQLLAPLRKFIFTRNS